MDDVEDWMGSVKPPVETLLAVDPSIVCTGLAFFRGGILMHVGRIISPGSVLERAVGIGERVASCAKLWSHQGCCVGSVALEWPQAYSARKSKSSGNTLFGIPAVCGAICAKVESERIHTYLPAEWAGQIPKSTAHGKRFTSARGKAIATKLSAEELEVFHRAQTHDEVDAVGIGLHHLGRGIKRRT